MFFLSLIEKYELSGHYLFAMEVSVFWAMAILTVLLGVGVMWLANSPQPKPNWQRQ